MQDLLFSYQEKFNLSSIGKTMPVLFEHKGRHSGQLIGRTPYMQNVHVEIAKEFLNKIVDIKITSATVNSLTGELAETNQKASWKGDYHGRN